MTRGAGGPRYTLATLLLVVLLQGTTVKVRATMVGNHELTMQNSVGSPVGSNAGKDGPLGAWAVAVRAGGWKLGAHSS